MVDREKVIECLTDIEQIMIARQEICPREELQYWVELQEGVADALELLKEQNHSDTFTVIDTTTGKEADEYNIALHEDWAKHLCYCDMEGWAIENDGSLLLVDECGRFAYADRERFKVIWDDWQGKGDQRFAKMQYER